ncbi:MAG: hypothetical protein KGD72_08305 [Candidatus Lokiarchaeota archaeon]|nr:hypothetical protein [Candidatus Lokiarchaeota archaeon]
MKPLIEKQKQIDNNFLYVSIFKLVKSYLVLISDEEGMGIGTVTLGIPSLIENMKTSSASHQIFGIQSKILSKIIVDKISSDLKEPVLLLLFLKHIKEDQKITKPLIELLKEALIEITQK